jgi:hypothetical protein
MRLTPHMDRSAPREWLSDPVSEFIEFMSQFCLQAFSRRPGRAPTPLVLLQRVMENEVHSSHGPFGIPGMAVRLFGIHRIYVAVLSACLLGRKKQSLEFLATKVASHAVLSRQAACRTMSILAGEGARRSYAHCPMSLLGLRRLRIPTSRERMTLSGTRLRFLALKVAILAVLSRQAARLTRASSPTRGQGVLTLIVHCAGLRDQLSGRGADEAPLSYSELSAAPEEFPTS